MWKWSGDAKADLSSQVLLSGYPKRDCSLSRAAVNRRSQRCEILTSTGISRRGKKEHGFVTRRRGARLLTCRLVASKHMKRRKPEERRHESHVEIEPKPPFRPYQKITNALVVLCGCIVTAAMPKPKLPTKLPTISHCDRILPSRSTRAISNVTPVSSAAAVAALPLGCVKFQRPHRIRGILLLRHIAW